MEAIAAAASFLAIVNAIAQIPGIVESLRSFIEIDPEIQALFNELSTLQAMQDYVKDTVNLVSDEANHPQLSVPEPAFLLTARHEMQELVDDLRSLVTGLTKGGAAGRTPGNYLPRRMKFLWQRRKICQLAEKTRAIRSQIHLALSSMSLGFQHNQGKILLEVHSISSSAAGEVKSGFNELRDLLNSLPTVVNQTSYSIELTNHEQDNHDRPSNVPETIRSTSQQRLPHVTSSEGPSNSSKNENYNQFVHLLTSLCRKSCMPSCTCQCHSTRTNYRSPRWLKPVLGNLFVNYGCFPVIGRYKCDQQSCANTSISEVTLDYYFPLWLWNRALCFTMLMGQVLDEGTSLHIYCPRVLPDGGIFRAVEDGNLRAVQNGFSRFMYTPQDTNGLGKSLLFVALDWGKYGVVNFLAQEWNLKRLATQDRLAIMRARERLLSQDESIDPATKSMLKEIAFSKNDSDSNGRGKGRETSTSASVDTKQMNKRDFLERTPLIQACTNNNIAWVKVLVEAGAPLNTTDWLGRTALMTAVYYKHYECATILINAGCDVDAQNIFKWSALFYAIPYADIPLIRSLTKGKDLRACKGHTEFTPVHEMTRRVFGPEDVARECLDILLKSKAPIDAPNSFGDPPIHHAISKNNSLMVRLLAESGAQLDLVNEDKQNVLHMAALFGNIDTIQALLETNIPVTCRWNLEDKYGNTPLDSWLSRLKTPDETPTAVSTTHHETEAFEKLVMQVRNKGLQVDIASLSSIESVILRRYASRAVEEITSLKDGKTAFMESRQEVETLRVLLIQIKEEMWDAAEETVGELLDIRQEQLRLSPFEQMFGQGWDKVSRKSDEESADGVAEDMSAPISELQEPAGQL